LVIKTGKKYVCIASSFLVINVCNQGNTLCSPCSYEGKIEGRIEGRVRRGRRLKRLLDGFKEKRGNRKLKEEALNSSVKNSLRDRLWTCLETDCRMNEMNEYS
jgi:hypothetical protein